MISPITAEVTNATEIAVDAQKRDEAAVIRKAAWRLLPIITLCYIVSYLDRSNIGIAALTMMPALNLTVAQFGFAAGIFFVGYCLGELPSNLLLVRFGARRWLARIMISWGIVAVGMAFVAGPKSLYAMRIFLGFAEAGFTPGAILYLAYWFPSAHRARVFGIFLMAIPVSMIVGAPISSTLLYLRGFGGLDGWQWLFIVEGGPAILLGVVCLFYLPNTPKDAKWLSAEESRVLTTLLESEQIAPPPGEEGSIKKSLRNPKMWELTVISIGLTAGSYSLVFFLPQIISDFGTSHLETGLLTAVPFLVSMFAMFFWTRHSDQTGERRWHIILPMAAASCGLIAAGLISVPVGKMIALSTAAAGVYMAASLFWGFIPIYFERGRVAAAAIAIINMIGALAGFFCPYAIGLIKQATGGYLGGLLFAMIFVASGALMAWHMTNKNKNIAPSL